MHTIIATYTTLYAFAVMSLAHYAQHKEFALTYPMPLLLIAGAGMFFKKSWGAHLAFGTYGIALILCIVGALLGIAQQVLQATSPSGNGYTNEHTALLVFFVPVFLTACASLYIPIKLLNTNAAKSAFGVRMEET